MVWTAPQVGRSDPPLVGDERTMLQARLDYQRQTLLYKCRGLSGEELRRQASPPPSLSLLGLVRHMSEVERSWFRRRIGGDDVAFLYSSEADPDGEFDHVDLADAEADFARFREELVLADAATAGRSLDDTFFHAYRKTVMSVRWVFSHMIEEYARHNGHADLLRERIEGQTGS